MERITECEDVGKNTSKERQKRAFAEWRKADSRPPNGSGVDKAASSGNKQTAVKQTEERDERLPNDGDIDKAISKGKQRPFSEQKQRSEKRPPNGSGVDKAVSSGRKRTAVKQKEERDERLPNDGDIDKAISKGKQRPFFKQMQRNEKRISGDVTVDQAVSSLNQIPSSRQKEVDDKRHPGGIGAGKTVPSGKQRPPSKQHDRNDDRTAMKSRIPLRSVQNRHLTGSKLSGSDNSKQNVKQSILTDTTGGSKRERSLVDWRKGSIYEKPSALAYKVLFQLEHKEPREILRSLSTPQSGFMELIHAENNSTETTALILKVLAKICLAKDARIMASFINKIVSDSQFMYRHLQQYIVRLDEVNAEHTSIQGSFQSILSFLCKFQELQPMASIEILTFIIPLINTTLKKLRKRKIFLKAYLCGKIELLQLKKDSLLEEYEERERKQIAKSEKIHCELPPEDYRNISILPTKQDFTTRCPFLRPNIKRGSYLDATHYLDVQFRLLREDYIRPLREILKFFSIPKQKIMKKELKIISIYTSVQIHCPFSTEGGIVHLLKFDSRPFRSIRWEASKRLLPGSLLCLSQDNFETMLFATVATTRDPHMLKNGELEVHFVEMNEQLFSPSSRFVMVESEAYFEAYRHTLTSLQRINESALPFKNYIVNVSKSVEPPQYLSPSSAYNFSSTFQCLKERVVDLKDEYPILNSEEWPSEENLGLDHSQYLALHTALTKEFAIIQGPPGTGKTYIGLKIAQVLLENSHVWKSSAACPILVVCYTNHALDQFLEGILSFTKKVVRIGGRSKSEAIKQYTLSELRHARRKCKLVPSHIYNDREALMEEIEYTEEKIIHFNNLLKSTRLQILPIEYLQSFMEERHYMFFVEEHSNFLLDPWLCEENNNSIESEDESERNDTRLDNAREETEEDIDFELGLREVDKDDYSRICTYKRPKEIKTRVEQLNIRKHLEQFDMMTTSEARAVINLRDLHHSDRWRLYRFWRHQFLVCLFDNIKQLQKECQMESEKLQELRAEEDNLILVGADVVGMTTTGAAKYHKYLQELQPRIVIVEEAAEVLEAHIITSLTCNTQHLILIGDHQQLKPSPTVYELAVRYHLDVSLFERMIENGMSYCQLTKQHRMRPCIAKLLTPYIYENLENHHSVEEYENILGVGKNLYFINHCFYESKIEETKSCSNSHEANFIVALCRYLRLQGYEASKITILTTYNGQLSMIKRLMKKHELLGGVRATVVDNFQGEENDIILLSLVRSNDKGSIGFLKVPNRVCVALSRARKGFYCIGNFEMLAEVSDLWKNIMKTVESQNSIGTSLILCCQNHPGTQNQVVTPGDFSKCVPDGGCVLPCDFRLSCGHVCPRSCHPNDRLHKELECKRECAITLCDLKHKCPKLCYEKCGECEVFVDKVIPKCGHKVPVPCHLSPEKFYCPVICERNLPCGHIVSLQCHLDPSEYSCITIVHRKLHCGHTIPLECYLNPDTFECPVVYDRNLPCGHTVPLKCCLNLDTFPCPVVYDRKLPCGHMISLECNVKVATYPCPLLCDKKLDCGHNCRRKCNEPCHPCCEKVEQTLLCGHHVTVRCYEIPYLICPAICKRLLPCGHTCKNICGSPCPPCELMVVKSFPCGHNSKIRCCDLKKTLTHCEGVCGKKMHCGHACQSKRDHKGVCGPCFHLCKRVLRCGHKCLQKCYQVCPRSCRGCSILSGRFYRTFHPGKSVTYLGSFNRNWRYPFRSMRDTFSKF